MNYFIQSLTYFRILIAPVIFILITLFDYYGWALILFLLASVSDYWDGFLARKYKLESIIGSILDPIADKILVIFLILALSIELSSVLIAFLGGVMLARDFWISALRDLNARNGISNATNVTLMAKTKTSIQFIAITGFLAGLYFDKALIIFLSDFFLVLAMLLSLQTGFQYSIQSLKLIKISD
tara:strand:- start:1832 stop:2383 length:552 start_codon:yes stop_codon:yes gene_type:complete